MKRIRFENGMTPSLKVAAEWMHCSEFEVLAYAEAEGLAILEDGEEQVLAEPTPEPVVDEEPEEEDSFLVEFEDEIDEESDNEYPEGGEL